MCIVKANSMCPSSHDDVYIYFNVSRQLFFYSYVIIPATINHNNVNTITGDLYINRQFVVLHTFTQTLFHAHHSREMQEIFRCALNNKRKYFIEPFLISVSCKRDHVWRWFQSNPLILLIAFNHSYRRIFLSDRDSSSGGCWSFKEGKLIFGLNHKHCPFIYM